jgi:hypothetical protein
LENKKYKPKVYRTTFSMTTEKKLLRVITKQGKTAYAYLREAVAEKLTKDTTTQTE